MSHVHINIEAQLPSRARTRAPVRLQLRMLVSVHVADRCLFAHLCFDAGELGIQRRFEQIRTERILHTYEHEDEQHNMTSELERGAHQMTMTAAHAT